METPEGGDAYAWAMASGSTGFAGSIRRLRAAPHGELRRVVAQFTRYRLLGVLAVACALAQAAFGLVPALVVRNVIDNLEHHGAKFGQNGLLIGLGLAAMVVAGVIGVGETYVTLRISKGVVADLRGQVFDHLLRQSVGFHTRTRAGDLMSKIINDVEGIDTLIGSTMLSLVTSTCAVAASLVLMFILSWQLSLVTLILFPILAVVLRLTRHTIYYRRLAVQEQFARITSYLHEILGPSGITLVKSLGRESHETARFHEANAEMRRLEVESGMAGRWITLVLYFLQLAGPAALLLIGTRLVVHGVISLGTLVAFAAIAAAGFGAGLSGLATGITALVSSMPLWARIFVLLDEVPDVAERASAFALASVEGAISFEDVSFTYEGQATPALREVSVCIAPGQLVALVGPSGAGKTTFSNLVARFYDPQVGRVQFDGHDLRDLTLASVSDAIGLVLQETYLFHRSIRENLLYGRPDATEVELARAVHHAALDEVISGLPDGLETLVGERGFHLSGGEKQRVAIARVILRDPAILILDEATSQLDSASEQSIQRAMTEVFRGRTSLVIAHRLSTIRAADLILVMDHGRIVESGTHDQLQHSGGLYADLHAIQFRATA
jgi:ATP-binding cassette subfamily B protein